MTVRAIDRVRVLRTIHLFGRGLVWTVERLAVALTWSEVRTHKTVAVLLSRGLLERAAGAYYITDSGRQYVDEAVAQRRVRTPIRVWVDEALSGITANGERSEIVNAVLPTGQEYEGRNLAPDAQLARAQLEQRAHEKQARDLGLTVEQYFAGLRSGSVHMCRGLDGHQHVGQFDRDRTGWQALCRKCRKARRILHRKQKKG